MVKISVVVPVYNMEDKVERCLDSLVNQTLKDIELIVINDGSKDKSDQIIKKYLSKYSNIKYINRSNKGISYTRNEGIKKAKGDYIGFVDSDDYVELDMYEKMYKALIKSQSDIVVCSYNKFNNDDKIPVNISSNCLITNLYDNPSMVYKMDYSPWNKLFKKELWDDVCFPDKIKYEDLEAVLKVFLKTNKVTYIDEYLYNYLVNENGETGIINDKVFDILTILDNLSLSFENKNKKLKKAYKILCTKKIFEYVHRIIDHKDYELCISFVDKGYKFLDRHFRNWKVRYLLSSNSIKDFIMHYYRIHPNMYKKYIIKKIN